MKLTNIRQDSVNAVAAQLEDGTPVTITNADDSEVTALQMERLRKGRSTETVEAQGMVLTPPAPEPQTAEIVNVSGIHGETPGSVDVSLRDGQMVRVALDWEHVDIETSALTDAASARIEAEVIRKGGYDAVEWSTNA